jgi:hypothetical protein
MSQSQPASNVNVVLNLNRPLLLRLWSHLLERLKRARAQSPPRVEEREVNESEVPRMQMRSHF